MPTPAPLVLYDVLDVGPPPAPVVAQPPCGLVAGPPPTTVLDLHGTRRVEPADREQPNTHSTGVAEMRPVDADLARAGEAS